jgi:YHS domain-containing protein
VLSILEESKDASDPAELKKTMDDARSRLAALKADLDQTQSDCDAVMHEMQAMMLAQPVSTAVPTSGQGQGQAVATSGVQDTLPYATSEAEIKDVCGDEVDINSAPRSTYRGQTYYFCSKNDKQRFDRNPERYIKPGSK